MDFIDRLQIFLKGRGYGRVTYGEEILWLTEKEDCILLVQIIPEQLPGQERRTVGESEGLMTQAENTLMIRRQKRVDRLTIWLSKGMPDQRLVEELAAFPNIWCLDWKNGKILVYEHQRTDFDGMREALEEVAVHYLEKEKMDEAQDIKRLFRPVTSVIFLINIAVFIFLSFWGDVTDAAFMAEHGALTWYDVVEKKEYYRLITSTFLHFGLEHLLQNMLILLLIGSRTERVIGKLRYGILYFGAGLAASVTSLIMKLSEDIYTVSAGASGAIFGIMGGMLFLILKNVLQKKKNHMGEIGLSGIIFMIMAALSYGFFTTGVDNAAHIGGLAAGFLITAVVTIGM